MSEANELQGEGKKRDVETAHLNAEAQRNLEHHHRFAVAVTLFQVAIGLAAIAALLQRPSLWYVSLAAGGARRWPSPTASPWSCDPTPRARPWAGLSLRSVRQADSTDARTCDDVDSRASSSNLHLWPSQFLWPSQLTRGASLEA